jgi:KDO2-lipid IV(A) lauroyltransferase
MLFISVSYKCAPSLDSQNSSGTAKYVTLEPSFYTSNNCHSFREVFVKSLIVYLGIAIIWLISLLPLATAQKLGAWIGQRIYKSNGKTARRTRINLKMCYPNYPDEKIEHLALESLVAMGKSYTEIGMTWMWPVEKARATITEVEGEEYLHQALEENNGIILIAPHLGNWEILNHFFRTYLHMTVMYKKGKIPAFDRFVYKTRKRVEVGLVPADKNGVLALFDLLENKKVVAVLPDQQPKLSSGVFAPFFGQTALTGKLIGELASKSGAYLMCCYAKRLPDGNYGVVLKPASEDIRDKNPVVAATALNRSIEECIRECPEQYQWSYKRFRTQPDPSIDYYHNN